MTSNTQNRWVNYGIVAALVLLLVGVVMYISSQFERVKTTFNLGYTAEAIQNPYLAAQQYLQRQSIASDNGVDIASVWDQLQPGEALLLLNPRLIPEPYHLGLMEWVAEGGHLIVTAQNYWSEEYAESGDPFLDQLGVEMYDVIEDEIENVGEYAQQILQDKVAESASSDDESPTDIEAESSASTGSDGELLNQAGDESESKTTQAAQCDIYGYSRLTLVNYGEQAPPLQVQFGSFAHLYDASAKAITPEIYYPNQMLQYPVGRGMITTLTSHAMWSNENIGWYDHAYFLWLLVNNASKVWFVFDRDSDSLLSLILDHVLEPFAAGLLLLALYLWYRAKRFGPLAPEPQQARRSLMEHLEASARFNWRHRQIQPMVQKQREDIRHRFILRYGSHHQEDFVITTLAKASELTPKQVRWALKAEPPEREQEFTRLIRLLQRLRNAV